MIINFNSKNAWIGLFCYSVSSNLLWKRSIKLGNNALTKFIQDVLIGFVPLILHFRIFDWTYNWNHYRRIRVNVISLKLKSWVFLARNTKICGFGFESFENKCLIWNQLLQNRRRQNFVNTFWLKVPKFGCLGSNFSKANVIFEISTFVTRVQTKFH